MYVRGEWYGHMQAISKNGIWCESIAPDNTFCCTLAKGHESPHRAGVDMSRWVAEWDDNRSTDGPVTDANDFFRSIGL